MNKESTALATCDPKHKERCAYRTRKGYQCRNSAVEGSNHCYRHAGAGLLVLDIAAPEILTKRQRLDSVADIHEMLTRVARALVAGRIHPRYASALTYLAQTLLTSLEQRDAWKPAPYYVR